MRATFVGTGDAFSRRFGQTNVLIEAGDVCLMLDFGHLAPQRLEALGYSLEQLTHVLVSHIHSDHIGGLEELAFVTRFVHQRRMKMLIPEGLAGLMWEHSLRGGLEMVADEDGGARHLLLESYFEVEELNEAWHSLGPIAILPFRTDHVPGKDSWGFVLRDEATDERMIFGCDTRTPHPQLMVEPIDENFSRGPIFHDCQLTRCGVSAIHVPLSRVHYPEGVQERVVLVHYSDDVEEHLDRIERAGLRIACPGDVITTPDWQAGLRSGRSS